MMFRLIEDLFRSAAWLSTKFYSPINGGVSLMIPFYLEIFVAKTHAGTK